MIEVENMKMFLPLILIIGVMLIVPCATVSAHVNDGSDDSVS